MRNFIFLLFGFLLFSCQNSETPNTEIAKAQTSEPDIEAKLLDMGITLPEPSPPVANYVNAVRAGNLLFLAGKGPKRAGRHLYDR